jgi:hypothetical protein
MGNSLGGRSETSTVDDAVDHYGIPAARRLDYDRYTPREDPFLKWMMRTMIGAVAGAFLLAGRCTYLEHKRQQEWEAYLKANDGYFRLLGPQDHYDIEGVKKDPALAKYQQIPDEWFRQDQHIPDMKAAVERNLFFNDAPVVYDAAKKEEQRILQKRAEVQDVELFRNRHVILLTTAETWYRGDQPFYRFGTPATIERISKEASKVDVVRIDGVNSTAAQQFATLYTSSQGRVTVVYDGHGKPTHLETSGYGDEDPADIGIAELQGLIRRRWAGRAPSSIADRDIFIFDSCFAHDYSRGIMHDLDTYQPIMLGQSEYGQIGFTQWDNPYDSWYLQNILGFSNETPRTIGKVIENESKCREFTCMHSNPFVYVPDEKNKPMQIS